MKMTLCELIEIKISATGETIPQVDSGTEILLVQDGKVSVGKLNYNPNELFSIEIEHPTNQEDLNPLATEIVKSIKTELLNSDISHILTCPSDLKNKMNWEK